MSVVTAAATAAGVALDADTIAGLDAFVALLARHGARSNLVGTTDPPRIADEIVLDAARLAPLVREAIGERGRMIDIGAGAGIPIIPLLIALPGWSGVAVEPREKRRRFMSAARRSLGLGERLEIVEGRLEPGGVPGVAGTFDLAVSKAVFEPDEWVARSADLPGVEHVGVWLGPTTSVDAPVVGRADYSTARGTERAVVLVARG